MSELDTGQGADQDGQDSYQGAAELDAPGTHYQNVARRPKRTVADWTDEERTYNRRVYGQIYSERYGQATGTCVSYCQHPGQKRRGPRCPACYGPVTIRAMTQAPEGVEAGQTRAERFAAWCGGWWGAFVGAILYPFQVDADHTRALIRNTLQDALAAGLTAEIIRRCPDCGTTETITEPANTDSK